MLPVVLFVSVVLIVFVLMVVMVSMVVRVFGRPYQRWHYRHYTRIPTERERARKRERERDRESTYFSACVWHCYSQPSDGFTKATFVICIAHI